MSSKKPIGKESDRKNTQFEYHGMGTIKDMPEDKRREYEENKKNVRRIFEDAMENGVIAITSTKTLPQKGSQHHDSAIFINGVNPVETLGIIAMTIQRLKMVMDNYLNKEMMGESDDGEPSRYIG
jgi:hypothetical protein